MNTASYTLIGGDYDHVGLAASDLKQSLKRLGVPPDALRRVAIAVYEAEANVVVHAHRGTLCAVLKPSQIDVEVTDEGPGIPDIERAMEEGYSTASPIAMGLGFGAGMGLPSIRNHSGSFAVESEVGRGTRVCFSIPLSSQKAFDPLGNSLRVTRSLCRACMHCLPVCPTRALRVRQEGPEVLGHLCIDCAACVEVCQTGALRGPEGVDAPPPREDMLLVVPASFFVSFGPKVSVRQVFDALSAVGYRSIRMVEAWEVALHQATVDYTRKEAKTRPILSPVCPAVVNLIEMRFPSLLSHLAPFLSPVEAAREELAGQHVVFGLSCPAQHTVLSKGRCPWTATVTNLSRLRRAILPRGNPSGNARAEPPGQSAPPEPNSQSVLQASGLRHVVRILDEAENEHLADFELIELWACDQGCFGVPGEREEPFVAWHRWRRVRRDLVRPARAFRRKNPFVPRSGMRLDNDMSQAIEKLLEIDFLAASLPGKNCGMCGAPTCDDMAEDLVLGRVERTCCPHVAPTVWGKDE